jgi:lipopolysaccharide transport system ATP-binding protein
MAMNEPVIRAEQVGKRYRVGVRRERYPTLRAQLASAVATPVERMRRVLQGHAADSAAAHTEFWALRDVDFAIGVGEVVGIIGRNGAGKSTLLKVLSRITEPSVGSVEITGRVGTLLEVGTGFHPELSGRENIYLNGAILGMRRAEIERRFDEIVAFAEVERFLDTPVKHYSSGMHVRLGFAVAAHLDTEILMVDEVLSVGDAAFQRKCVQRLRHVARAGRTVLFVSHDMATIEALCTRVLLLRAGSVGATGSPHDIVPGYLAAGRVSASSWTRSAEGPEPLESDVVLLAGRIVSQGGGTAGPFRFDEPLAIEVEYRIRRPVRDLAIMIGVANVAGQALIVSHDTDSTTWSGRFRPAGDYVSRALVPPRLLRPGHYPVDICAHAPGIRIFEGKPNVLGFDIADVGFPMDSDRGGLVAPVLEWDVKRRPSLTVAAPSDGSKIGVAE